MADVNPFEHPPLYREDQVIVLRDLSGMYMGFQMLQSRTRWWQFRLRRDLNVAMAVVEEMVRWLSIGKPEGGTTGIPREGEKQ